MIAMLNILSLKTKNIDYRMLKKKRAIFLMAKFVVKIFLP